MNKIEHRYTGTPFSIEATPILSNKGWATWKVEVFREVRAIGIGIQDHKIGEYVRTYPSFVKETFCPFEVAGEWYALYSSDYTCTRVAKLTDTTFEDWCGEEPASNGFCPVEFYVPRYHTFAFSIEKDGTEVLTTYDLFDNDVTLSEFRSKVSEDSEYVSTQYTPFGFLCGCVWGDDSSWKLRYIDLSKVEEKQIVIDQRFGYWELPDQPLRDCVHFVEDHDDPWLYIHGKKTFHLDKCKWED